MLQGCETDIDIIAPKRDVTIIYGLLEANKTRQYIRINKAFVAEGAASDIAAQQGVNEYSDSEMTAKVMELHSDGSATGRVWNLQSTYVTTKEDGAFFSDSNKVYYFDATLNTNKNYRIECTVNVEGEDTKVVSAETAVLGNRNNSTGELEEIRLTKPNLVGASSDPSLADRSEVEFLGNGDYRTSTDVNWLKAQGGVSYTCYYRFYYRDRDTITGITTKDSLLFTVGTVRADNPNSTGEITFNMNPEEFFIQVEQNVPDYDFDNASFKRIASDTLQYFLEIADNTLATYIEVNQPATEIVQEQPEYTNVTNGIGIFASRYVTSTRKPYKEYESGRVFTSGTLEELLYSNQIADSSGEGDAKYYTNKKGFLVPKRCNNGVCK